MNKVIVVDELQNELAYKAMKEPVLLIPSRKGHFGEGITHRFPEMPGRNEPCLCGSGKKFKKCCLDKVEQPLRDALVKLGKKQTETKEAA